MLDFVQGGETRLRSIGIGVLSTFTVFTLMVVLTDDEGAGAADWAYLGGSIVVAAAVWMLGVLRTLRIEGGNGPAAVGLVFGILGVAAIAAFWTAFSFLFGAAALLLGTEAKRRVVLGAGRPRMARASVVLGGIALMMFAVIWLTVAVSV